MTIVDAGPRCRMCVRPARYIEKHREFSAYCGGTQCTNQNRLCQCCGAEFFRGSPGAGTKYCSLACKTQGYHPTARASSSCTWCGAPNTWKGRGFRGRGTWPYICDPCLGPIRHVVDRLKAHHVSPDRARRLRDDPSCEICGTDVLARVRPAGMGRVAALLVVDHDHECCPVDSHSCGDCIRGLICRPCNTALGMLRDDPKIARLMAEYLESKEKK